MPKSKSKKVPKDEPLEDDEDEQVQNEEDQVDEEDILYESQVDGLIVTQRCKFWLHIVSKDQWEAIKVNTDKGVLYLGSYSGKPIKDKDLILFYMKDSKGKPAGFVAVGQVCKDMEVNKSNLRVYDDKNLNRFVTELSVISILHDMCRVKELSDAISSADTPISTSTRFSLTLLRGEGVFVEIPYKQLGLALIKELITINDKYYAQRDENNDSVIEDNDNEDNDNNNDIDDDEVTHVSKIKVKGKNNTKAKGKGKQSKQNIVETSEDENEDDNSNISSKSSKSRKSSKSSKSNDDGDETEEGDDNSDVDDPNPDEQNEEDLDPDNDEVKIVTNAPIMLIICDKLRRSLKRLKQKTSKIKSILTHCTYCSTCDVTNNNPYEMNLTFARIDESTIKFIVNDYERALNAYLEGAPYPKTTNKEFIKIHHLTDSLYYSGDVLIEYSTRVEPIIEITEAKTKAEAKTKPVTKPKPALKTELKSDLKSKVVPKTKQSAKPTVKDTMVKKPKAATKTTVKVTVKKTPVKKQMVTKQKIVKQNDSDDESDDKSDISDIDDDDLSDLSDECAESDVVMSAVRLVPKEDLLLLEEEGTTKKPITKRKTK